MSSYVCHNLPSLLGNPSATLGYVSLFKTIQIQNTTLSKISIGNIYFLKNRTSLYYIHSLPSRSQDVPNKVVDQFLNMMNTNTTIRCIALYPGKFVNTTKEQHFFFKGSHNRINDYR